MSTPNLYRVWLIVPDARQAGLNQFIQEQFDDSDWLLVPLSDDGQEPTSHYACSFACTHAQTSIWAGRLTSDGGVDLPANFATFTPDQRIAFMEYASPDLENLTGVIVRVCRNDVFPWAIDVNTVYAAAGLQPINEPI